jgi:hypothetical protein
MKSQIVSEIVRHGDGLQFLHVFQTLADEDIPGLPPGGGLSAKYVLYRKILYASLLS